MQLCIMGNKLFKLPCRIRCGQSERHYIDVKNREREREKDRDRKTERERYRGRERKIEKEREKYN